MDWNWFQLRMLWGVNFPTQYVSSIKLAIWGMKPSQPAAIVVLL